MFAFRGKGHFLKEPFSWILFGFKVTLLNFVEFDIMHDSTQSFAGGDGFGGSPPLARATLTGGMPNYAGENGRLTFAIRNTQLGLQVEAPKFAGMTVLAHCRIDFNGPLPSNPQSPPANTSESTYFNSPAARLFHCYVKEQSAYIDVLAGLTYTLFSQQPMFFPASVLYLGLPGEIFTRAAQLRLSHEFHTRPVNVYVAAGVFRPPQRDSEIPDVEAAARIMFNGWRGARTFGAVGTDLTPLSLGVSGIYRNFKVQELAPVPVSFHRANGWGVAFDALLPILPAKDIHHVGNSITANATVSVGSGDGDQFLSVTGGVPAQTRPPAMPGGPPGAQLDIDPGLAMYDPSGALKTVNWQNYQVGLQYYLPGPFDIWITGNYTYLMSTNLHEIVPPAPGTVSTVFDKQHYVDASVFWALTPHFQIAIAYAYTHQTFLDGGNAHNHRIMGATYFVF
jgi:hypothetical protein